MRESGIEPFVIGEVLERRDLLMRSLAQDRVYSLDAISAQLETAADDQYELEIALVAAARALGFNAKHISGASEPDGLARYYDTTLAETKITLEAKSSQHVPGLPQLDFAGLGEHVSRHGAKGCLLLAPNYPGRTKSDSAVAHRAKDNNISCWLVSDLAKVVRLAEAHQINAWQVANIVLTRFAPEDVHATVEELLAKPNMQRLYREVLDILRSMNERRQLPGSARTVQHVSGRIVLKPEFESVQEDEVRRAVIELANASQGAMRVTGETILFFSDIEELSRRLAPLTGEIGPPRGLGTFRSENGTPSISN